MDFPKKLQDSIAKAKVCLDLNTELAVPDSVPHLFSDKFCLCETLCNVSFGAVLNVFEILGLNSKSLKQIREWAGHHRSVTLRFAMEERCLFVREAKREEESKTQFVREHAGAGKTTGEKKEREKKKMYLTFSLERQGRYHHHRVVLEI